MNLTDYIAAATGGWLILAALGGTSWALVAGHFKRRTARDAEHVNWLPFLPPVPQPISLVGDWPVECATQDEIRLRLDQIAAAEGWSPVTEDWAA